MSADVFYYPVVARKAHMIDEGAPSSFRELMEEVFGSLPLVLTVQNIDTLRAMSAVGRKKTFEQIIEGIEKFGAIELRVEWL